MRQSFKPEKKSCRKTFLVLAAGLFLFIPWFSAAAEITLDRAEMFSRGHAEDGKFVLSSALSADIALSGGYKYAFLLGFSFEAADLSRAFAYRNSPVDPLPPGGDAEAAYNVLADRLNNQTFLGFRVAKAGVRDMFNLPLELSYFIGEGDDFATGDDFGPRFGLSPFGTSYRGFFYFPDSIRYDGIYGVRGTGLSFSLTKWETVVPMLYIYKDFAFSGGLSGITEEDLYSGDLRVLLNHSRLRLEAFTGVSAGPDRDASMRAGLMVHLAGNGVEFFAQGGIPGWTNGEKFSIDNLFFLLEPRLHFNVFSLFVTFFYHPAEYIHIPTNEQGRADLNVKFLFGNTDSENPGGFSGGIEAGGEFYNERIDDFVLRIAPFGSFFAGGLQWDAKLRINPLNHDPLSEMFELFFGVRTAF